MISKIDSSLFSWSIWRGGTLFDLGVPTHRYEHLLTYKNLMQQYAIGYCDGVCLSCRPKVDTYAVMFQKDDTLFWTHLPKKEFADIFVTETAKKTLQGFRELYDSKFFKQLYDNGTSYGFMLRSLKIEVDGNRCFVNGEELCIN